MKFIIVKMSADSISTPMIALLRDYPRQHQLSENNSEKKAHQEVASLREHVPREITNGNRLQKTT